MAQEETETYKIKAYCTNCLDRYYEEKRISFEIPKGQWVDNFLDSKICESCGCQGCLKRG